MVSPYGSIEVGVPDVHSEQYGTEDTEGSALLGNKTVPSLREGRASIVSSVSNLSNTIIGSGMLTFPLAMASAGIIPGIITCASSGAVCGFGSYLLTRCARAAPHRQSSFFAVSQLTFPQAAAFFDAAIAVKCFGVTVSYLIIIKSLMPSVVASIFHDLTSQNTSPPEWALSGHVWITLVMLLLAPLSFLRGLDSLRYASYIAIFSVVYLVMIVITCYFRPLTGALPVGDIHLIHFTPSFITTLPVQVFAFTCGQNIFPIYNELRNNSQRRLNTVIGTSIGGSVLVYEIIAIFGYLTFGSKVGANIIAMYPSTSLFIAIGQLAIVALISFSYPLQVQPCRICLDKIFGREALVKRRRGEDDELDRDGDGAMSTLKHALLTGGILFFGFMIAYNMNDLQLVLSFVGSTGSTTVSFILPGLFFWKLTRDDPSVSRLLNKSALALAMYGCCIFVFCLAFDIYQVVCPPSSRGLSV